MVKNSVYTAVRHLFLTIAFCAAFVPFLSVQAATFFVNDYTDTDPNGEGNGALDTGDLRYVLNKINEGAIDTYDVVFQGSPATISIGNLLPIVNLTNTNTLTVNTTSPLAVTIDGSSTWPGIFVRQGTVTLNGLTIQNTTATGGFGSGGGLGGGGALFINGGTTTISNMLLDTNNATGGISFNNGGGGMFNGNGGVV